MTHVYNGRQRQLSEKLALMFYIPNVLTPKENILFPSHIRKPAIGFFTSLTVWPIARNVLQNCFGTTNYNHVIFHLDLDAICLSLIHRRQRRQHQYHRR